MEKYNKFNLLRLPTFLISSCKNKNLSEIIDHSKNPIFSQTSLVDNYPSSNSFSPKNISSSSSTSFEQLVEENDINSPTENTLSHRKDVEKSSIFDEFSGGRCPPGSPVSPLLVKHGKRNKNTKKNEKLKNKEKITHCKNNYYGMKNGVSSSNETDDKGDWFSSDDDMEYYDTQTMFSLRSLSFSSESDIVINQTRKKTQVHTQTRKKTKSLSFSSDLENHGNQTQRQTQTRKKTKSLSFSSDLKNPGNQTREKSNSPRRRKVGSRIREVGVVPLEEKVKDTFAIVKSSSDPYDDFRKSMVEMIIEKQMYCAKELEQLLDCFICLNSCHHHRVIVEVFIEICDALFSNCS